MIAKKSKYILNLVLLTLLFLFCSRHGFSAPHQTSKYYLIMANRPPMPQLYSPLENYNLQLTTQGNDIRRFPIHVSRHHIIPYNILVAFFNKVVKQKDHAKSLRRFFMSFARQVNSYAKTNKAFYNSHLNEIKGIVHISNGLGSGDIQTGGEKPPQYYDDFAEFYGWMPWNLFIGPGIKSRTDDPGEDFEANARYIVNNDKVWAEIEQLYRLMRHYIDNPNDHDVLETINRLLTNLVANRIAPYRLDPNQWVKTRNSKEGKPQYHIKAVS